MFAGLWPSAHVRLDKCMTGFNTSFTEGEIMVIKQLEKKISEDEALQQQLKNGSKHFI